jgi:hypothetical protein
MIRYVLVILRGHIERLWSSKLLRRTWLILTVRLGAFPLRCCFDNIAPLNFDLSFSDFSIFLIASRPFPSNLTDLLCRFAVRSYQTSKVKGVINLNDYTTCEPVREERKYTFAIYHKSKEDQRRFLVQASNDIEMNEWVKAIQSTLERLNNVVLKYGPGVYRRERSFYVKSSFTVFHRPEVFHFPDNNDNVASYSC